MKNPKDKRQKYTKPEVKQELDLETKAGSPLGNPVDPINPESPEG